MKNIRKRVGDYLLDLISDKPELISEVQKFVNMKHEELLDYTDQELIKLLFQNATDEQLLKEYSDLIGMDVELIREEEEEKKKPPRDYPMYWLTVWFHLTKRDLLEKMNVKDKSGIGVGMAADKLSGIIKRKTGVRVSEAWASSGVIAMSENGPDMKLLEAERDKVKKVLNDLGIKYKIKEERQQY